MRIVILTSMSLRHSYFIKRLSDCFHVIGVWREEKSFDPENYSTSSEDLQVIRKHFEERDLSEIKYFETACRGFEIDALNDHRVPQNTFREKVEISEDIQKIHPEVILVFGTSIISPQIIEKLKASHLINLHLGISPYYRGSGTNFWPLVQGKPELVGATIHFLDSTIDGGAIIAHARPAIEAEDGPHDIGNKAIVSGVDLMIEVVRKLKTGKLKAIPQSASGELKLRKNFNADAIRTLNLNFKNGMLRKYLDNKTRRDQEFKLVSLESS